MKLEEGLGLLAAVVMFVIIAAAIAPESLWKADGRDHGSNAGVAIPVGMPAAVAPGGFSQQNLWAGSNPRAIPVAQAKGGKVLADQPVPQPGGVFNFERAPRVQFYGKVQQISEIIQDDGQIHVWIHDPAGGEMQISVAPNWYLKLVNCQLDHDVVITGSGFRFDRKNKDALVYAKKIQVNGHICHLRNDEGFALWSNKLR
ncbi:MAG: hypothetical protein HQL74_03980 [Magnetococcales bacterium]|nr:hypothetical protein [Magnetococcales bacterium]